MKTNITSREDLRSFAAQLRTQLSVHDNRATIVTLDGDLGSGKTTLVQTLGQLLGITESITSPTYTIMQSYDIPNSPFLKLIHIDAYRIETADELAPLRFNDLCATPNTLICIEWAEKLQSHLPHVDVSVHLEALPDGARTGTLFTS